MMCLHQFGLFGDFLVLFVVALIKLLGFLLRLLQVFLAGSFHTFGKLFALCFGLYTIVVPAFKTFVVDHVWDVVKVITAPAIKVNGVGAYTNKMKVS